MRVLVCVCFIVQQHAPLAHELDDLRVGLEDLLAREMPHVFHEDSAVVHGVVDFEAVVFADDVVVVTVPRRRVNRARPRVERDVIADHQQPVAIDERVTAFSRSNFSPLILATTFHPSPPALDQPSFSATCSSKPLATMKTSSPTS